MTTTTTLTNKYKTMTSINYPPPLTANVVAAVSTLVPIIVIVTSTSNA
jgi:hypothetical protein